MKETNYNQTAYRILLLFRWLAEKPLTFNEINDRFKKEPLIGKQVSMDTLWLYINTLKALGCIVTRPSPKNSYTYSLTYHPFSYYLTDYDIQVLKETFQSVEKYLEFWETIHFSQWLQKVFKCSANNNRDELSRVFFEEGRLTDFEDVRQLINHLDFYCQQKQLLRIQYLSPVNDLTEFGFFPKKLFHVNGTLYLLGKSEHKDKLSMLRVDKIANVCVEEDETLRQKLSSRRYDNQAYIIRILNCSLTDYDPLEKQEEVLPDPSSSEHLLIKITTDNEFLLKQKLLTSDYQFQILYPSHFRDDVRQTLKEMRLMYL